MTTHEKVCLKAAKQLEEVKMSANDLINKLHFLNKIKDNTELAELFTKQHIRENNIESYISLLKSDVKELEQLLYLIG